MFSGCNFYNACAIVKSSANIMDSVLLLELTEQNFTNVSFKIHKKLSIL